MKLVKILEISGVIHCDTGLRIGGSKDTIEIGGLDNPVIRHPLTDLPYIPGSSLKGKLRSLLEGVYGRKFYDRREQRTKELNSGEPCGCGQRDCKVCRVFGPHKNTWHSLGPTRILVRDSKLTESSRDALVQAQVDRGIFFTEIKTENINDRKTGTAKMPRTFERVPEGTEFTLNLSLKLYDIDNEADITDFIKQGLKLLELDYLGSSGSRGYGQISFKDLQFVSHDVNGKVYHEAL